MRNPSTERIDSNTNSINNLNFNSNNNNTNLISQGNVQTLKKGTIIKSTFISKNSKDSEKKK